jgi:hypothetical protein
VLGLTWGAVDLERGEITAQAGRVLLDGHRTAVEDPKSGDTAVRPPGYRVGRHVRYRRTAVEAWLETQADQYRRASGF